MSEPGETDDTVPALLAWAEQVNRALELEHPVSEADLNRILGLAGRSAHGVRRPAAPLTTYLVGLAMGADPGLSLEDAVSRVVAVLPTD